MGREEACLSLSPSARRLGTLHRVSRPSRRRTIRKKVAIGLGLVLLALLVTVLVALWMQPAEPPLQVGMSQEEVDRAMGNPGANLAR